MRTRLIIIVILISLVLILTFRVGVLEALVGRVDYDCIDFKTQKEAQEMYDKTMKEKGRDVYRLDANKDGIACQSLP